MVLWDSPLIFLSSLANGTHSLASFLWGLVGAEETVSQTRYAFIGRRGASTKPYWNGLLLGLGIDGEFVRVVELAGMRDCIFTPYAAHQGHGFIGHGATMPRRAAHREPLGIVIDTQPEGWQHATVAEEIDSSDFLRQHQRITHGQDSDAHAKFDALRPARDHGQTSNGFKGRSRIADTVVEPDRIEPAFFDQINKVPKIFSARKGPATKAYADTDFHRDLPVVKSRYRAPPSNWRHLRWAVNPAILAGIVAVRSTRAQHLAWEGTRFLEPCAVIFTEQGGNRLLDLLVIACEPGTLGIRELGPVYEPCIEGDKCQRVESQPAFATRVWRHVVIRNDDVQVLEADTAPA